MIFSPFLYEFLHVVIAWPMGRLFPYPVYATISYFVLYSIQGFIEHFTEFFPTLVSPPYRIVIIVLSILTGPPFYYLAYQMAPKSNKQVVLKMLYPFVGIMILAKAFEIGFPKDEPADQIEAMKDDQFNLYHMFFHIYFVYNIFMASHAAVPIWKEEERSSEMKKKVL